jgi:hypothetical protein
VNYRGDSVYDSFVIPFSPRWHIIKPPLQVSRQLTLLQAIKKNPVILLHSALKTFLENARSYTELQNAVANRRCTSSSLITSLSHHRSRTTGDIDFDNGSRNAHLPSTSYHSDSMHRRVRDLDTNVCTSAAGTVESLTATFALVLTTLRSAGSTGPGLDSAAAIALRILTLAQARVFIFPWSFSY